MEWSVLNSTASHWWQGDSGIQGEISPAKITLWNKQFGWEKNMASVSWNQRYVIWIWKCIKSLRPSWNCMRFLLALSRTFGIVQSTLTAFRKVDGNVGDYLIRTRNMSPCHRFHWKSFGLKKNSTEGTKL